MSEFLGQFKKKAIFSCGLPESDLAFVDLSPSQRLASKIIGTIGRSVFQAINMPVVGCGREALVLGNPDHDEVIKIFWATKDKPETKRKLISDYSILREYMGEVAIETETETVSVVGKEFLIQRQPWLKNAVDFRDASNETSISGIGDFIRASEDTKTDHSRVVDLARRGNLLVENCDLLLVDVSMSSLESYRTFKDQHDAATRTLSQMAVVSSAAAI